LATFAALANELGNGLLALGEPGLAESVSSLRVYGRCPCRQQDCGAFYTKPEAEWKGRHGFALSRGA
jgi:hypothetical protein